MKTNDNIADMCTNARSFRDVKQTIFQAFDSLEINVQKRLLNDLSKILNQGVGKKCQTESVHSSYAKFPELVHKFAHRAGTLCASNHRCPDCKNGLTGDGRGKLCMACGYSDDCA